MAIQIFNKYSPRANAPDSNYPEGSIKNEFPPDSGNGTPLDQDWGNDYEGFTAALLAAGGVSYSGNPDTVSASDRMTALNNIIAASTVPAASQSEMDLGTEAGKYVSPKTFRDTEATTSKIGTTRQATQAEVDAGSLTLPYVSPATLNGLINSGVTFTQSRVGHLRLPPYLGGFLINWGLVNTAGSGTGNFDLAFPTNIYSIAAFKIATDPGGPGQRNPSIFNVTKSSFQYTLDSGGNTSFDELGTVQGISYIAIGL